MPHRVGQRGGSKSGSRPSRTRREWKVAAMRRYDDPVEVRRGMVGPAAGGEGPEQFLWRGRLWKVRDVVAHWVETGPWWQSAGVHGPCSAPTPGGPRRRGRCRRRPTCSPSARCGGSRPAARRAPAAGRGVFDLSFDWAEALAAGPAARTEGASMTTIPSTSPPRATPTSTGPRSRCARRSPPPRSRCATPTPTSPRCGPPPRCSRPGPPRPPGVPARPAPEERLGAARRGGARAGRVGGVLLGRGGQAGRRRGRAPGGRSPSGRPTTWSATPTGSSAWSSRRSGLTRHVPFPETLPPGASRLR